MQISIANAIQVARRIGAAAAEVITTNLKMWLGFETSETLGREEVVNGDFALDSDWVEGAGWEVVGNGFATCDGSQTSNSLLAQVVYTPTKVYKTIITVDSVDAGYISIYTGTANPQLTITEAGTYTIIAKVSAVSNTIYIQANVLFEGSISNVSVKELTQFTPDKSGNNNVGELFTGKALEFNGSTDRVEFVSYPTSIKSVVFWYKPLVSQQFDSIIWLGGIMNGTIGIQNNQGTINCTNLSGKVIYVNNVQTESVTLNQWQRVVINFPSKTLLGLGFGRIGSNYGDCQLSDIQFYNENLSLDDIAYDYANPQNLVTDREGSSIELSDLRGYWHLSEGAGSTVYDSSGGGNNGTINGATHEPAQPRIPQLGMMNFSIGAVATGVTLIPNPSNTSQDIDGNAVRDRLNSFNLDGSGYAEVADDADLDFSGQLTLETWAKADFNYVGSIFNAIYSINGSIAATTGLGFYTDSTKVYYRIGGATNSFTYTQGKWYYLAIIRDSSNNFKFYKGDDGVISEVASGNNTVDFTSTESKFIGKDATNDFSRYYSNLVDNTRAYDRGLTLDEIKNNYNAGLSAHTN